MPQTLEESAPVLRKATHAHKTLGMSAQRSIATWLMLASMMVCMGNSALGEGLNFPDPQNTTANQSPQDTPQDQQQSLPNKAGFTLPAGTKLPLGLVRPLSVKSAKPGMSVYLQVTFPVSVGQQMLVPPGTYVQGVIEKIIRRDRSRATLEFTMRSASLIFSNGYTVTITGNVTVSPATADLISPPASPVSTGEAVPVMAALGGPPALPPLPPLPQPGNGARDAIIGIGIAGAAAAVFGFIFAVHHSDIEMETGTPMEIILAAPVSLDVNQAMSAVQQYDQQTKNAPPEIVQPPKKPAICYDSGSAGTPDTVIPGTPGTPDTVIPGVNGAPDTVIPGIPATPSTVIPGTPGTPPSSYPCPR
jgi:hypothetical protein